MLPFSSIGVSVPDPVLGSLSSLCVLTFLLISLIPFLTMHMYVPITSKFIYADFLPGCHIYKHKYPLKISPWTSDMHLNLTSLNPNSFSFPPSLSLLLPSISCLVATLFFQLLRMKFLWALLNSIPTLLT